MKEVISIEYVTSIAQHASIFTRLTSLVLGGMPMLESIYQGALLFPSLEIISVIDCPRLRRLPIDSNTLRGSAGKEETGGRRFNLKGSHLNTASQAQKLKLMREQDECSKCDGIKLFA
ncbi:unnamed protein product, partial [Vitis vinifera]